MNRRREPSGEDLLIERFFKPLAKHPGALSLSDDAAVLSPVAGHDLVLTADMLVAGVHFFPDDPADTIAKKALRVNLSDLAAKGAVPVGALLSISFPSDLEEEWVAAFSRGLGEDCVAFSCPLMGGDTTRTPGPLAISVTAIGQVPSGKMVKRAGAEPGDLVVVTGTVGDGVLGLMARKGSSKLAILSSEQSDELLRRYLVPEPRIALAPILREYAHAAMDVSDGLAGDLAKLARVSGVAAKLDSQKLPLSNPAHDALVSAPELLRHVLSGGDDYEVLAAIPEVRFAAFAEAAGQAEVPVTAIGQFAPGSGIEILDAAGAAIELPELSFSHF